MTDYGKPETVSLEDLKLRIKSTDLVPSRESLMDDIDFQFAKLSQQGIQTWRDLQMHFKTPKQIEALAQKTDIDLQYLVLLRREVEGYFPKPFNLNIVDWVPHELIARLIDDGIIDSGVLFVRGSDPGWQNDFAKKSDQELRTLDYLVNLVGLTRVQWVSPTTARMLIEAGYLNCAQLAAADAEKLCADLDRVNKEKEYFNGKIGLRDIKRLIIAAGYTL